MALNVFLFDNLGEYDVASYVNVFSEVEPILRRIETNLNWLPGLSRLIAADGPFVLDVDACWGVYVSLHP